MEELNYSKRELDHYFADIRATLEKQNIILNEIKCDGKETKEQAIKTNGRVNRLEYWRGAIAWSFGVILSFLLLTVNKLWK
jgi:hypothetical protein